MAVQSGRGFGSALSVIMRNVILHAAKTVWKSLAQKGLKTASGMSEGVVEGNETKGRRSKKYD